MVCRRSAKQIILFNLFHVLIYQVLLQKGSPLFVFQIWVRQSKRSFRLWLNLLLELLLLLSNGRIAWIWMINGSGSRRCGTVSDSLICCAWGCCHFNKFGSESLFGTHKGINVKVDLDGLNRMTHPFCQNFLGFHLFDLGPLQLHLLKLDFSTQTLLSLHHRWRQRGILLAPHTWLVIVMHEQFIERRGHHAIRNVGLIRIVRQFETHLSNLLLFFCRNLLFVCLLVSCFDICSIGESLQQTLRIS